MCVVTSSIRPSSVRRRAVPPTLQVVGSLWRLGLPCDDAEVDALCETRLRQWAIAVVFERSALEANGIDVVPTFRTPHVTLAHAELEELVERLTSCEHRVVVNPYHEADIGPLETP